MPTVTITATDREGHAASVTVDYAVGQAKPVASNTGVPAGTVLTVHNGDMTISTPGTVLDSLDIHGRVSVTAANVTIKRCRVRGNATLVTNVGLINATNAAVSNLLIEDCTLAPDVPSIWWNGITGHDFTARRCNVYGTVDGVGIFNTNNDGGPVNVVVTSCYIHDLAYFSPDSNHAADQPVSHTHNDCVQVQGGTDIELGWNNLQGFCSPVYGSDISLDAAHANSSGGYNIHAPYLQASSAIQINVRGSFVPGGFNIHDNWIDGGAYSINTEAATYPNFGTISNNVFGDQQRPDNPAYMSVPKSATVTGNVHEATGLPVPTKTF